ncbi:MAG: hypothetical protein CMP48_17435 [Rickettsiales bacterium]|jgi:predicted MPP superfamily phosphohydrolase|nr:hypothetical protein [Rickettsiales bacterium]
MSEGNRYTKKDFNKLFIAGADEISSSKDSVEKYAEEEGLDIEAIRKEGSKRIKQILFKAKAAETKKEMVAGEHLKKAAVEFVEKLMSEANFTFSNYIKTERIALHNKNLESLTEEDIKNTLIEYHYLKMIKNDKKD